MNKTININLGGYFFHIDEAAYDKLRRYLDAVSNSLNDDPQGKNEIISDIESRISELLSEKIKNTRQVVNETDIEEVIKIMGQPEDYVEVEEGYAKNSSSSQHKKSTTKKFFRDGDDKFLGGVCSGIGHYIGIDAIWIRLAFIVLVASGVSPIVYILLWILLPIAKTTSEKLQMEGEHVNIDNIEKKIRNEFDIISNKVKDGANELSDKISSADYEQLRNKTKSGFQEILDTLGTILKVLFKIFGKFMGVLLLIISGTTIITLILGLFSVGSLEILNFSDSMVSYPPFFYSSMLPISLLATFLFLLIGIPFIALFILGLRILSSNVKKLNTTATLTLIGIWIVSLLGIGFSGIEYATSQAHEGLKVKKESLAINKNEPVTISVRNNDDIHYLYNLCSTKNSEKVIIDDQAIKYSNRVRINVKKSNSETNFIEILKKSKGNKNTSANISAEKISYNFKIIKNKIILNAFFLSDIKKLWHNETVYVTIFVTEGTKVLFEKSSKCFLRNIKNTNDIYDSDMANHEFKMTKKGFECTDCDSNKKETNDNDVSFLFNSTINDTKADFRINKKTTKQEIKKIIKWFKEKNNIVIEVSNSKYNTKNEVERIKLTIDCNDGHRGTIEIKQATPKDMWVGFTRNYKKTKDNEPFKTY